MSKQYHNRRRKPPSSTIIPVTDRDSDTTTSPRQTGRRERNCRTWSNLALGALIPLTIGIGTVVITLQQQRSEERRFQQIQDNEDRRRNQDQQIASWTREQDQRQADDLHHQNVYSHYVIDISNSIFKQQNHTTTFVDNRTRLNYIRSQTLTALFDLDCRRKTWLFKFLYENRLLPSILQSTSLDLRGANLSCITLKSANAKSLEFKGLVLPSADLKSASFVKCLFEDGADFSGSSLENVKFTQSFFRCDNRKVLFNDATLSHIDFSGVYLCNVTLSGADLSGANFTAVTFQGIVDLTATNLSFTTFKDGGVSTEFSMVITNSDMTGSSILEDEWFNTAMYQGRIEMMNVILPNGTWLINETINLIQNGNAEQNVSRTI